MTVECTIPEAKSRLLHNIANEFAAEPDFAVSYTVTGGTATRACEVGKVVGLIDDHTQDDRPLPYGTLEERYTVILTLSVGLPTDDYVIVERQLYADYRRIRRVILADPTLGGLAGVVEVMPTGSLESDSRAVDDGRFVWLVFGATVTARIDA